ncbi:HNH endonuclease [Pseudomonas sp. NY15435]|uniref:HNH endonuclease n=1 Tax=Pseudomonas sp. NY15435 TaxID=3400358 RepID=UPI003A871237
MKGHALRRQRINLMLKLRERARQGDETVWSSLGKMDDLAHADLKKVLRQALKDRQEPRCCYCKRWLFNQAAAAPIEHVLPRHTYPTFAVRFRNLAIACVDCNTMKSKSDWGNFPLPHLRYPSGQELTFFHPRFHEYDEHVRFARMETNSYEYVIYKGLTPQGLHLCRELLNLVVGKQCLKRGYPSLAKWQRVMEDLDAHQPQDERPALEAFRKTMEQAIGDRLKDGHASALWIQPAQNGS